MLGGLVSSETVCTCISCVLEISVNYPLLIVLYTGDVEFFPNSLVPLLARVWNGTAGLSVKK